MWSQIRRSNRSPASRGRCPSRSNQSNLARWDPDPIDPNKTKILTHQQNSFPGTPKAHDRSCAPTHAWKANCYIFFFQNWRRIWVFCFSDCHLKSAPLFCEHSYDTLGENLWQICYTIKNRTLVISRNAEPYSIEEQSLKTLPWFAVHRRFLSRIRASLRALRPACGVWCTCRYDALLCVRFNKSLKFYYVFTDQKWSRQEQRLRQALTSEWNPLCVSLWTFKKWRGENGILFLRENFRECYIGINRQYDARQEFIAIV